MSFGFGSLFLVLCLVGVQSVILLSDLGESIDVILRENFRSVIACQDMKEALERIDSAALFTLVGHDEEGRSLIEENREKFAAALQVELNNITLPGELGQATAIEAETQRLLSGTLTLARQLGAIVFTYKGTDIVQTILRFAHEYRVGHIAIGTPGPIPWWKRLLGRRSVVERLVDESRYINLVVIDTREKGR